MLQQFQRFFPGIAVRDFLGFPSLKEVECSGSAMSSDVDLIMSITLFKVSSNKAFVYLNTHKSECTTFHDYSSCTINSGDSKKSSVRTLVADLEEDETVYVGCNITTLKGLGRAQEYSWSVAVHRESKKLGSWF
jgi:hypothetical protein